MPTYQYRCPRCGEPAEYFKPMALSEQKEYCVPCAVNDYRAVIIRKVFSPVAAIFRGGGFYSTGG